MMAEKKYPGDEGGLDKLKALISEAKGPELHGATVGVLCCYITVLGLWTCWEWRIIIVSRGCKCEWELKVEWVVIEV